MALAKDLMQVGIPDQAANRLGYTLGSVTGAGTTTADAALIPQGASLVTASGAASSGIKLQSSTELGAGILINNTGAASIILYPPTGGGFNQGGASYTMVAKSCVLAVRNSTNGWFLLAGAATA